MADDKEHKDEKEERQEDEDENVDKAYDVISDTLKAVVESQKTILESHKALAADIDSVFERVESIEKAGNLGEKQDKTELEAQPSTSDKEDIGAKVTIPNQPFPTGEQAGLKDDGKATSDDTKELKIEQKAETQFIEKSEHTFTTETPRPNAALETVDKSYASDYSQILKDARAVGHDGLSEIALKIQKGVYYKPSDEEVRGF